MKKFFAIAALAVASLTANAQAWLGGSFNFNWEKGKWDGAKATTSWKIAPEIGYNINENWAIAGKIAVGGESRYTKELGQLVEKSVTTFTVSPYARYTFAQIDDLSFFVDGGIHFTSYGKDNGSSFGIGIQPGLAYKVADGVTLAAKFGYFGWRTYDKEAGNKDQFGLGVDGNNLEFGIYFDL
jgi:hypothetical protein